MTRLKTEARGLAREHDLLGAARAGRRCRLEPRLKKLERTLGESIDLLAAGSPAFPLTGAEWLLDNEYLIRESIEQIRENLPPSFFRQLPRLRESGVDAVRAETLVRTVLDAEDDHLDLMFLRRFVDEYQEVQPLTMGELWSLPTLVRLLILEDLVTLAATLASSSRPDEATSPAGTDLRSEGQLAACVRTLLLVKEHDWPAFFESVSRVNRSLERDPAAAYAHMDFETRDLYRRAVERFAQRSELSELGVAETAVELAGRARSPRSRHVGWWLLDDGREELARSIGGGCGWATVLAKRWRRHGPALWVGGLLAGAASLLVCLGLWLGNLGAGAGTTVALLLLGGVVAIGIAIAFSNWLVTLLVSPHILPKLDYSDGLSPEARTLVVVPCLLLDVAEIDELLRRLEISWLGNRDARLSCALLADFADARAEHLPDDAVLEARAREGVRALNQRHDREHGPAFHLFLRRRAWNPAEHRWMGWERKRGKLMELNRLLRGAQDTTYVEPESPPNDLEQVQYVITLDADTRLPAGAALRLVGAMAHPLNVAVFGRHAQDVRAGYTILQPRVETLPSSAGRSLFSRLTSGDVTLDLYAHAVSDVYQDLFQEGSYAGKGIYDVDAFARTLRSRAPDNVLLSHDLFESAHGRAAYVSDIVLYEECPAHPRTYYRRLHRWIRGDWQIAPWLGWRVPLAGGKRDSNRLSLLDRWKILDNLRRSLWAPAVFLLLTLGWFFVPLHPGLWTLAVLTTALLPAILGGLMPFARALRDRSWHAAGRASGVALVRNGGRALVQIAFLPYEAWLCLDAVGRTLLRLLVTHEHLLEWVPAAQEERRRRKPGARLIEPQDTVPLWVAVLLGAGLAGLAPHALVAALPFLMVWCIAPFAAPLLARSRRTRDHGLTSKERARVRRLTRRTWLFFDRFVGPADHWLPPDHYQADPCGDLAHRTSPTNIGLSLVSVLGAWDLGYVTPLGLAARVGSTLATLQRLPGYRGHWLNWYDTRELTPLVPAYVSTVDSGNLAASLLCLAAGLEEVPKRPLVHAAAADGLFDSLGVLAEDLEHIEDGTVRVAALQLSSELKGLQRKLESTGADPESWARLVRHLSTSWLPGIDPLMVTLVSGGTAVCRREWIDEVHLWMNQLRDHVQMLDRVLHELTPWLPLLLDMPSTTKGEIPREVEALWVSLRRCMLQDATLQDLPAQAAAIAHEARTLSSRLGGTDVPLVHAEEARCYLKELARVSEASAPRSTRLLEQLRRQAWMARDLAWRPDFEFLYDRQRKLFRIGYNVTTGEPDPNHYDLLASEARIASYLAIAKGDVPVEHWLHLGRPLTHVHGHLMLLSWSGTMFEYLMPALFMLHPHDSLLEQSCRVAVRRQRAYGVRKGPVWGTSESGFYAFDRDRHYRYRAFGVPGLGLRRDLADDLVFAPYASFLALPSEPRRVLHNLDGFDRLGMLGRYGYFEAVDRTPSRFHDDAAAGIVRSYMAHHQGMILVAAVNALLDHPMVARFHSDEHIATIEHLLWEHVPHGAQFEHLPPTPAAPAPPRPRPVRVEPWAVQARSQSPQIAALSNGQYSVHVTASGAGMSTWRHHRLMREDPDPTIEGGGCVIYVSDEETGYLRSATLQPCGSWPEDGEVLFAPHKVEFRRREDGIFLRTEVGVGPLADVEIRRVHLSNETDRVRRLSVVSYAEIVLAPAEKDLAHPSFSKMFVEADVLEEPGTVVFHRRACSEEERPLFLGHAARVHGHATAAPAVCTDRERFLGRLGSYRNPEGLREESVWDGDVGASLDPIAAIRCRITLEPHGETDVVFLWAASRSLDEVRSVLGHYSAAGHARWAFELARARSERELQAHALEPARMPVIQELLSRVLCPDRRLRVPAPPLGASLGSQSALWPTGISGDLPILLVRVAGGSLSGLVNLALRAHAWWSKRGVRVDLVMLDEESLGYQQPVWERLQKQLIEIGSGDRLNQPGGVHLLHRERLGSREFEALEQAAAVVLDTEAGDLGRQLRLPTGNPELPAFVPVRRPQVEAGEPLPDEELLFDNGTGGFSRDGREYVIRLLPGSRTPAPWANVLANQRGGVLVTESGIGSAWAWNSGENRLTPWRNDPVLDPPSTVLYVRDEETGEIWSPTPSPSPSGVSYEVRHRAGETVWRNRSKRLDQELVVHTAHEAPAFFMRLELRNLEDRPRRLTVTCLAEWVLGTRLQQARPHVLTEYVHEHRALLARNPYNEEYGSKVAFLAADRPIHGMTCDRQEFLGRNGTRTRPRGLVRIGLSGAEASNTDPCGVLQVHVDLPPHGTEVVRFAIGQRESRDAALSAAKGLARPGAAEEERELLREQWEDMLGRLQVDTPDPAFDLLLNRWLPYQNLSCRIDARTAMYQSSGGYGFRDQLQDVLALLPTDPGRVRSHLLESARHQFEEGDVLHWWHPPRARGVRTRCSDDLLWLPYATTEYVSVTGDDAVLDEKIPYLSGPVLRSSEAEVYGVWGTSSRQATLYEHCLAAIERGWTRGRHGLPLLGTCDWNDGLDQLGRHGRGESVWLGWFLGAVMKGFAPICEARGDQARAQGLREDAERLFEAADAQAWDGEWYLRAWSDDGHPIGSSANRECSIDTIAQAWSVIARGDAVPEQARRALEAVMTKLVSPEERLVLLLQPPFDREPPHPGYIRGYPPGIRENGGQYTHAAVWVGWALSVLRDGERTKKLFDLLNPILRVRDEQSALRYRVEPYVLAADVGGAAPYVGRGGWTWYTGSAAWAWRLGAMRILGLRLQGRAFRIEPCIPESWRGYRMTWRAPRATFEIDVCRSYVEATRTRLDGNLLADGLIPLIEDGRTHDVEVEIGCGPPTSSGGAPAKSNELLPERTTHPAGAPRTVPGGGS